MDVSWAQHYANETHKVRLKLVNGEGLPAGVLREEIDASWRRSYEYGLNCLSADFANHALARDLDALFERNRLLMDAATPELEYLAGQQGKGSLVILSDANAHVLSVAGHTNLKLDDIHPGSCWSESLRGTNAIGTTIVEGRPTLINHGEHYLDRLSGVSCTAVPLRDPSGQVVGVLDITREGVIEYPQDHFATLLLAAGNIESRMFSLSHPEQLVLAFHNRPQYLGSAWHGLLALNLEGEIVAVSERGCDLLAHRRERLLGRKLSELLGDRSNQLVGRLLQGGVSSVQTAQGELFLRALQAPKLLNLGRMARPKPTSTASKTRLLEDIAGTNTKLARTLRMAQKGFASGLPVLLQGETGTGKELVARSMHYSSARSSKPFVAVNCAAIPEGLIESELFGYREGAFTGSRRGGMVGRVMQAHGGTLFLDEIGDMPFALQVRLLRVLQERKVTPLGAADEQDIDVAIICATHHDLKQQVAQQRFREDLYYRINGVSVRLPALRERDDLSVIIQGLLHKFEASDVSLAPSLLELFAGYDWPGNIRQLEMVLRSALAMREESEKRLDLEHLTDALLDELTASCRPPASIRTNELELIREALDRYQGNVSAAADALGISRATLYRKLKQLRG